MKGTTQQHPDEDLPEEERKLRAELEEIWQEESPETAKVTDLADEVDGELGTRPEAGSPS